MGNQTDRRGARRGWWLGLMALGLAAYILGRMDGPASAPAQSPAPAGAPQKPADPPGLPSDYSARVVAYIYNTTPITREELGEYLIERFGANRLELLVNKKIIEHECQKAHIEVNAAEVEASFESDCVGLGVSRKDFLQQFLTARHKTEFEWKEDVIRPRLMLTKLCHDKVKVEEQEIREAFEAHFGEKVKVRVIALPAESGGRTALQEYDRIRSSDEEFDRAARTQANSALAAKGGEVAPIGRYSADSEIVKVAFSLRPGELSSLLSSDEFPGYLIMKCTGREPPAAGVTYEQERDRLHKEVYEKNLQVVIKDTFKQMHEQANPKLFMQPSVIKESDMLHDVQRTIKQADNDLRGVPLPQGKK